MPDAPIPSHEDWPTITLSAEEQAQLARVAQFVEDLEAGRVDRGVDSLAIGVAQARHFAPGELPPCCDDDAS